MVRLNKGSTAAQHALELPREQWRQHAHFPSQVLLLGSHDAFRRVSLQLIAWAESGVSVSTIQRSFEMWKAGMHSHERYEEIKLYPYLERRWGVSVENATAGHDALAAAEQQVRTAFGDPRGPLEALRTHHDILIEHLSLEEDLVIPALLALTPEEFATYYSSVPGRG